MVVNTSARNYRLIINGKDCTPLMMSFEVGDSKLDQSGLIIAEGSIELAHPIQPGIFDETLDDRINPRWARGNPVVMEIWDEQRNLQRHPKGALRIARTYYDPGNLRLRIELTCLLGLLDFRQPPGDASDVCVGTGLPLHQVVKNLLNAAAENLPGITIAFAELIPGHIFVPLPKGGGSYVGQAGELCFAWGYALWVDRFERIRFIRLSDRPNTRRILNILGVNEVSYRRLEASEIPPEILRIKGSVTRYISKPSCLDSSLIQVSPVTYTESFQGAIAYSSFRETTVRDCYDFGNRRRTRTTITKERAKNVMGWYYDAAGEGEFLILSEQIFEEWIYRLPYRISVKTGCEDGRDPWLQRYIKIVYKLFGAALSDWITQHQLDEDRFDPETGALIQRGTKQIKIKSGTGVPGIGGRPSGVTTGDIPGLTNSPIVPAAYFNHIIALAEITDYTYGDRGQVVEHTTITWEPAGAIYAPRLKHDHLHVPDPAVLYPSSEDRKIWGKRYNDEWAYRNVRSQAWARLDSQTADRLMIPTKKSKYTNVTIEDFMRLRVAEDILESGPAGQTQPPQPETMPARYDVEEVETSLDIVLRSDLVSPFVERVRVYNVPGLYVGGGGTEEINIDNLGLGGSSNEVTQAQAIARVLALLLWGRYKGIEMEMNLSNPWFNYQPLMRVDVEEYDRVLRRSYTHMYLVDGATFALTQTECLVGFEGLWLGTVDGIRTSTMQILQGILLGSVVPIGNPIVIDGNTYIAPIELPAGSQAIATEAIAQDISAGTTITINGEQVTVLVDTPAGSTVLYVQPVATPPNVSAPTTGTVQIPIVTPPYQAIAPSDVAVEFTATVEQINYPVGRVAVFTSNATIEFRASNLDVVAVFTSNSTLEAVAATEQILRSDAVTEFVAQTSAEFLFESSAILEAIATTEAIPHSNATLEAVASTSLVTSSNTILEAIASGDSTLAYTSNAILEAIAVTAIANFTSNSNTILEAIAESSQGVAGESNAILEAIASTSLATSSNAIAEFEAASAIVGESNAVVETIASTVQITETGGFEILEIW